MKIMKELAGLPAGEISSRLEESKKELLLLRTQANMGTGTARPGKIRQTKKIIARLLGLRGAEKKSMEKKSMEQKSMEKKS